MARTKLLRLEMAARHLGVPATWLRREVAAGRVQALPAGASLLFDVNAVERALLARARGEVLDTKTDGGSHGDE